MRLYSAAGQFTASRTMPCLPRQESGSAGTKSATELPASRRPTQGVTDPVQKAALPPAPNPRARGPVIALIAVALFGVLVLSRTLLLGYVHYFNDIGLAFYPWHVFFAEQRAAGNWLPWCHLHGCGFPLWANGQSGLFYPPNLLFMLPLDKPWLYAFLTFVHHVLAATGMVVLARMMRLGTLASVVAGIIFAFAGFLWAHQIQYAMLCAVAWMPWCAVGAIRWVNRRTAGGLLLCALSFAAAALNHPQPPLIIGPFVFAIVWVWGAVRGEDDRPAPGVLATAGLLLVPLLLGGLLAAPAWMPLLDLLSRGSGEGREGYVFVTSYSLAPRDLVRFFFPHFMRNGPLNEVFTRWNFWEVCGYIGGVALVLALIVTPVDRVLRALRGRLLVVCAASVVLALGGHTPIYRIVALIPPYDRFRCPGRWLAIWSAAAALLVGLAIASLPRRLSDRRSALWLATVMLVFGVALVGLGAGLAVGQAAQWPVAVGLGLVALSLPAAALLAIRAWRSGFGSEAQAPRGTLVALPALGAAGAFGFGAALPLPYTPHLQPDILLLAAAALACAGAFFLVRSGRLSATTGTRAFAVVALLQVAHFAWTIFPVSPDRQVLHWPQEALAHRPASIVEGRFANYYTHFMPEAPWPNTNFVDDLPMATIYDPVNPPLARVTRRLKERLLEPEIAAAFGAGRLITDVPPDAAPPELELLGSVPPRVPYDPDAYVYRNPAFRGIAWTVTEQSPARDLDGFDDALPVLSLDAPSLEPPPGRVSGGGRGGEVAIVEWDAARIRVRVAEGERRALLLTTARLPGWSATIGGTPTELLTANGLFTAVELPDAACEVELTYAPQGVGRSLLVGALAALALLAVVVVAARKR